MSARKTTRHPNHPSTRTTTIGPCVVHSTNQTFSYITGHQTGHGWEYSPTHNLTRVDGPALRALVKDHQFNEARQWLSRMGIRHQRLGSIPSGVLLQGWSDFINDAREAGRNDIAEKVLNLQPGTYSLPNKWIRILPKD